MIEKNKRSSKLVFSLEPLKDVYLHMILNNRCSFFCKMDTQKNTQWQNTPIYVELENLGNLRIFTLSATLKIMTPSKLQGLTLHFLYYIAQLRVVLILPPFSALINSSAPQQLAHYIKYNTELILPISNLKLALQTHNNASSSVIYFIIHHTVNSMDAKLMGR